MIYILGILLCIGLDQWTKWLAIEHLKGQGLLLVFDGVLGLRYVENTGAAFSLLSGKQWLLISISVIMTLVLAGLMYQALKNRETFWVPLAYMLIISGAIGNLIDRVRLNYVVDFLEFQFIQFPVFNLADVFIVCGVILLGFCTVFLSYEF